MMPCAVLVIIYKGPPGQTVILIQGEKVKHNILFMNDTGVVFLLWKYVETLRAQLLNIVSSS